MWWVTSQKNGASALTLQRVLLGESVVGEKYQLTNLGTNAIEFAEPDLYRSGVMAVSVEQPKFQLRLFPEFTEEAPACRVWP